MDFKVNFLEGNGDVFVTTSGVPSPDDIKFMLEGVLNSGYWRPGRTIILDNSGLKLAGLTSLDIENLSKIFLRYNKELARSNIAVVAASDIDFGLSRMWQAYTEEAATFVPYICRSVDEALNWLRREA